MANVVLQYFYLSDFNNFDEGSGVSSAQVELCKNPATM